MSASVSRSSETARRPRGMPSMNSCFSSSERLVLKTDIDQTAEDAEDTESLKLLTTRFQPSRMFTTLKFNNNPTFQQSWTEHRMNPQRGVYDRAGDLIRLHSSASSVSSAVRLSTPLMPTCSPASTAAQACGSPLPHPCVERAQGGEH